MFSQRNNLCRSVSTPAMRFNTSVTSVLTVRNVKSWIPPTRPESTGPAQQPPRSFSAKSMQLHVIPQTLDIESQFQAVLGKCLFDKAVQIAEEGQIRSTCGTPMRPYSATPCSSRAARSYASSGANSTMFDDRTTLRLRPTRCTSPLVKGGRSFDSYINKGSIDQLAVAKTRGAIESSKPSIHRCLRRVKTASDQNLNDFSLKDEFTDKLREGVREQYWRRKKEEKIVEEETRERKSREKAEMMIILEDMKKEYEESKAKEALELQRLQLEAERIAKEKQQKELTPSENTENQINADDISSAVSGGSKSSKKRSSKKGKASASKNNKTSRKAKTTRKSSKRKSSVAPSPTDAGGQESGSNTPQPILKFDERRPSDDGNGETGQEKRVTFREKLATTRTIRPHKPVTSRKASLKKHFPGSPSSEESRSTSPTPGERNKPGSSKGKRGTKKGTKKKAIERVKPPADPEPTVPEPPPPPEPFVEPEPKEPEEPEVVIVEEPPEFCPAAGYKTRKQMVEEWLYYRSSSAAFRANPPIL